MQIKNVVAKPSDKTIYPSLIFEVEISHIRYQEAIVSLDGWLESDDGITLANLVDATIDSKPSEIAARDSNLDSKFTEIIYNSILIAQLDKRAVDYIEKRRLENRKRDVFLTLNLNVKLIVSKTLISHLHSIKIKNIGFPQKINTSSGRTSDIEGIMVYAYDPRFSTAYSNRWIISGDGSPVFLTLVNQSIKKEGLRISSTDWIHDFAPKLELGEYFVVEIPKGKTITKAWKYVEAAEKSYREWNTKGAYANCREVGKLLESEIKKKFKDDPIIKKWRRAINKFETLTSLDLHEEDITQEKPSGKITVGKPETEHILIVTKALIKYAEELLQEKS